MTVNVACSDCKEKKKGGNVKGWEIKSLEDGNIK